MSNYKNGDLVMYEKGKAVFVGESDGDGLVLEKITEGVENRGRILELVYAHPSSVEPWKHTLEDLVGKEFYAWIVSRGCITVNKYDNNSRGIGLNENYFVWIDGCGLKLNKHIFKDLYASGEECFTIEQEEN